MASHDEKLELQGFNNLTKSLSFNLYDISYAKHPKTRREYIAYIDESYSADRLTSILKEVTRIIGATVLNLARQDYHPEGSSVTMLIADGPLDPNLLRLQLKERRESTVAHLDKSHICVHTYPESHPHTGISTFRADIDVSTCGEISPLRALDFLLSSFEDDVVTIDYRVRGFTRDKDGGRHYIDHEIKSIRDYIAPSILARYESTDVNIEERNLFHTRLMIRDIDLDEYLFGEGVEGLAPEEREQVTAQVQREMLEIYLGHRL